MKAHSGKDPLGSYAQFMSHDPITNIDPHRDNRHTGKKVDIAKEWPFMKDRVPYGCGTHLYKTDKIKGGILDRTNISIK